MLSTPPSRRSVLKVFPRFAIILWLLAALPALGQAATVQFIDSWGHATSEIGYVRPVLVRVVDSGRGSALSLDSLSVSLSSPTGDVETVTCAETSRSSGVFEGQIQAYNAATASPQNQGFAVPDGLVATASYEPAAGGPAVTAEATANVIQLSFVGAGGAPVATVAEGALVSIELVGNEESFDPGQRDLLSLTVTRSGTSDSEVVELRETGNSSGIYRGSLQLASDGQSGAGILESSPAPATLTATYSRAFWPFLVRTRNVAVASAELELIDAFGNPAASVATEVRLRLREFYSGEGEGIGVRYATVSNDLSGDSELVVLDEVSPGVFEQRQPLAVSSSATTVGNLQLSAPAGSIVSAEHVLPSSGSVTASLPVGPSLTLLHADLTPAETFGKGEPLLIEVRFGGGNVSPARDTLTVDVSSDSAADTETALLTEISESSGVFRGRLNTLYTQAVGTSSNGVLEEGLPLLVYPTYRSERVHATFVAGSATASADAEVVFGRLETLHSSGEPATTFGSGATLRLRVQDFSVGTAGAVDSLSVGAACGSDFESLELRETAADSFVFEREVPVRIASSIYQNNKVECPTATTFDFNYYDGHVNILPVNLVSVAVEILSDTGEVGGDLLDGRRIRVRATDSSANLQPLFFDSVSATVSSRNTADSEVVTLRETSVNSGVFEGEVWVSSQASGSPLVSTAAGAAPLFRRDVITANYIGSEASAEVVPARLSLVDGSGNPISRAVSEVWVELEMPSFGSPTQVDMVNGSYSTAPWQSDNFTAYETSATSGIFTAHFWLGGMSIPEGSRFGIRFVTASETLSLSVPVVHYEVRFLDAAGAKLDSLPLGRPIRVEVRRSEALDNLGNWDQLAVALRSDVSEDVESLTLNEESTNWNGPLRGSLPLVAASTSVYDGTLQSGLVSPFGDTVRVELAGDQLEIGSAKLRRPQIFFRDAAGRSPEMLRVGDTYTVEVLDSAYDLNASAIDTFEVSFKVLGYQNDELTLGQLTVYETGLASGIFRAAFALTSNGVACPVPGNCLAFEPGVDSRVFAHHQFYGGTGLEEVSVRVGSEKLELVDADGNPVTEVLEGEPIHIRLTANDGYHTGLGSRTVTVGAQLSGDIETVTLWETFIRSGVYERTLPTRFFLGSSPPENGVLGLSADPQSEIATGESVIVHYNSIYTTGLPALEVSAATVAARLSVRNGVQPAVAVLPGYGQDWKIRLESPTLSAAGLTASFVVESSTGDIETYTVTSSPGGIFEAGVFFTTDGSAYPNDGVVFVYPGGKVKFRYQLAYGHQGVLELELPVAGAILRFVDADTGAVLTRAPDARPFKVQLIDTDQLSYQIDPPRSVTLTTALGGDSEPILLTEINPWYGIFEGTVVPRPTSSAANDGTLTVDREVLPNGTGIFDQVTASTYFGIWPQVLVSSTLQLDGPRLAWTDEAGQAVTQIQLGANAHLLVDDASRDTNPGLAETVVVTLDELPSGSETLVLTETGPTTGIFTGTIPVVEATPVAGDFQLQVTSGGVTRFHYSMPGTGSLQQAAWVTDFAITFVDANGNPTTSYLEGDTLRIRVRRSDLSGGSPTAIDVVPVQVRSLYWGLDQETVNLTETAVASGIFEGSIASQLAPTVQQNGVLEFSRGATFDAVITYWGTSGEASAQADFYGGSLRLLDRVGRPLNAIGFSQWLGVELTRLVGGDPQQVDTLVGAIRLQTLSNNNHDQEMLTLVETGPNTGIYIATIFTDLAPENPSDGYLQLDYQGLVRATFEELSSILQASVPITYNQAPQANGAFVEIAAGSTVGVERPWDSDPEGGALTLVGVGSSAHATGAIGPGNTLQLTAAADASGYESVAYLISDPVGMISEGTINIYYSSPPTITLLGPAPGTIFRQQGDVTLSAIASDLDEGDLTPYISWVSDLQGFLGSGGDPIFPAMFAQVGTHHLTASVTDASGHTATANLTIVIDGPPSFAVTAPPEVGEPIQEGAYTLRATATDLEDGDLGAAIVWTSVRRGSLGTGGELVVQMPPGEDQITATVTDSQGNSISIQRPVWVNSPPTAVITSPADGALLPEAEYFEIHATVGDPENLGYQLEWTVDTVPQQASYPALAIPLAPGQHRVSIRVTDPQGGEASDTVVFTVLSKPTLTISSPTQSQVFAVGAAVPLTATAADLEDGDLSAAIHWSSNIDGPLGIGASLPITTLSRALHVITATVEDSHGQVATSTVTIAVQDAPVVTITAPAPASAFLVGAPVNFAATAIDSESGDLSTEITWLSNLSGALGTGSALSLSNLPVGQHVVTARVSDPTGLIGTATVMITIHTAPSVSITAPATGTTVNQGSTVNFTGTANDNEDGSLAASISWSSNVDGVLGTGAAVVTSALSVGTHVITASVTDSHGAPATATVSITINAPPTVAITAPAAGSSYVIGASVSFTGSASDPEDGNLAASISWC